MNRKTLRTICLTMVTLLFLVSVIAGCQQQTDVSPTPTPLLTSSASDTATEQPGATEQPETPEPVTLSVFKSSPNAYGDWEWGDDMVSQEITRLTGVSLTYEYATSSNQEEFYTLLASGAKLPDFIHGVDTTGAISLMSQGFVLALNNLADQYSPKFYDVLPSDYELIHMYEDGNLYYINRDFGDKNRIDECEAPYYHTAGFVVNTPLLEQLGNPPLTTLEELKVAAQLAKEEGISFPIYGYHSSLTGVTGMDNIVQMLTRMCGGTHPMWLQDDGTVLLNVRQDEYIYALAYLNDLYRSGLFNPENFTISTDEQYFDIAERGQIFAYFGHPWHIFRATKAGQTEDAIYWPMYPPAGNGITQDEVRFKDNNFANIGSRTGIFISKDTDYPDRAIEYLTFLLTDEGQLLQWEGLENITYYYDENGSHRYTEERIESEARDPMEAPVLYGYRNTNFAWCPMQLINSFTRHLRCESQPPYGAHAPISEATSQWERKLDLAMVASDEDTSLLAQKVNDAWSANLADIILASDETAFNNAYEKMISEMTLVGLEDLEKVYSDQYKYWDDLGIE